MYYICSEAYFDFDTPFIHIIRKVFFPFASSKHRALHLGAFTGKIPLRKKRKRESFKIETKALLTSYIVGGDVNEPNWPKRAQVRARLMFEGERLERTSPQVRRPVSNWCHS